MMCEYPHRRFNQLTGEWVLVSPQRTKRPWLEQVEKKPVEVLLSYDLKCYLCPGNSRAGGFVNPHYESIFVFNNDFSALLPDPPEGENNHHTFLKTDSVEGICRVICFSSHHNLTMREMAAEDILKVVDARAQQITELGEKYRWVQIFI